MITSSTMRPTLGQCRAGIRSAAVFSRSSSLALLGAFTFYLLLSSLTAPPARHVRPFYRPAQTWNEQRKQLRPRVPAIVPARHVSITVDPPSASAPEFIPPACTTSPRMKCCGTTNHWTWRWSAGQKPQTAAAAGYSMKFPSTIHFLLPSYSFTHSLNSNLLSSLV